MRMDYMITKTQYHLLGGSPVYTYSGTIVHNSIYVLRVLASSLDPVFSVEIASLSVQT